ncbi:MAG: hypothetical protein HC868_16030 [Sphingomonadales bacterium]|nr:hypothetical protein [Sphingomonadales bacterium]
MQPNASTRDAWWRDYQTALFHRGLLRLRNPGRWVTALARYVRARFNQARRWAGAQIGWGGLLASLMRRPGVPMFERGMQHDASSRDARWHDYPSALFRRGLLRLRYAARRGGRSVARPFPAYLDQARRWAGSRIAQQRTATVSAADGAVPTVHRTLDILTFEQRGEDFVLIRTQADGSRSEIVLTATNVVHLGLLAPGFARQILINKVGQQPASLARRIRNTVLNANVRFVEMVLTILDRGGGRFDFPTTERRARALASKLVERADRIASAPKPAKELK